MTPVEPRERFDALRAKAHSAVRERGWTSAVADDAVDAAIEAVVAEIVAFLDTESRDPVSAREVAQAFGRERLSDA